MGDNTLHWEVFGRIIQQSCHQSDGKQTMDRQIRWMGVSPSSGSYFGRGITGGGDIHILPLENRHTVDCSHFHHGPVSGVGAAAGVKGGPSVVGLIQLGIRDGADCIFEGKADG